MADTCVHYGVAGLLINPTSGDCLTTDFDAGEITGLDGAPIRAQIDPLGLTNGGIVHPKWFGARIITFKGKVLIRSTTPGQGAAYATAVNVVEAAWVTALEGILNTPSSLVWTPTGLSLRSIPVTYGTEGGEIQFTGNMLERGFQFSLVAANPTIS